MCGQQCRPHVDVQRSTERARDAQLLQLVGRVEAVARLDLDCRNAFVDHRGQSRCAASREVRIARRARRAHCRQDAAARGGNFRVRRAFEPALELAGAVACIDDVRMAVDETGRRPAPLRVDRVRGTRVARHVAQRADEGDCTVADAEGRIVDRAVAFGLAHRREPHIGEQRVERRHHRWTG